MESLEIFRALAGDPSTGVAMVDGVEAARDGLTVPKPGPGAENVAQCDAAELPPTFTNGWRYRIPIIDMGRYLDHLTLRLRATGGRLEITAPVTAAELATLGPVVVNCTGLGARDLVPHDPLTPVRGDLLVADNPGIDAFFIEHDDGTPAMATYILPHRDRVILGGSQLRDNWSRRPDPAIASTILRRCTAADPRLSGVRVREHLVGLRPVRPRVRLGADERDPHVIHNYGHGGAGITLSWGCANEVLRLAAAAARNSRPR
jgi:D-amino-acid oxidase